MNFIKLYIGDYLRDTGTLTVSEHGAYVLMLLHHYATEQPLPTGRDLHRLLRAESKADRDAIDRVSAKFWTATESGLTNGRAGREMERAEHQREVNRTVGKLGGRPKRTETESVSQSLTESQPNRNPNHSQTPEKEIHPPATQAPPGGKPRGERLPAGWEPGADGMAFAAGQGMQNGRAAAELAKFRDYWTAQPGAKGRKADWPATWRNWVRKACEAAPSRQAAAPGEVTDLFRRGAA